jgi:hypothetical protein
MATFQILRVHLIPEGGVAAVTISAETSNEGSNATEIITAETVSKGKADYVVLAGMADVFPQECVRNACLCAECSDLDVVMMECTYIANNESMNKENRIHAGRTLESGTPFLVGKTVHLDRDDEVVRLPDDYEAVVYRRTALLETMPEGLPDLRHGYETAADLFFRIAERKGEVGYLRGSGVVIGHARKKAHARNSDNRKQDWYLVAFERHWLLTRERYGNELPNHIQIHLLRELIIRIDANKNRRNKHAIEGEELQAFLALAKRMLADIRDEYLIAGTKLWPRYRITFALQEFLLHLKYDNPDIHYMAVNPANATDNQHSSPIDNTLLNSPIVTNGECAPNDDNLDTMPMNPDAMNRPPGPSACSWPVCLQINGSLLPNTITPRVYIDAMNHIADALVLDCASPHFLSQPGIRWTVLWNDQSIPYEDTTRYRDTRYFGLAPYRQYTFRVTIPLSIFRNKNTLQFVLKINDTCIPHPMVTTRYPGRISTKLNRAYWCFGRYVATFNMGGTKTTLYVRKASALQKVLYELLFLREIRSGRAARPEMIRKRLWYWLSYPIYHRKNIWLTFDKLYKGGDNGEYFYKHCMTRRDTDVLPVYVINEDAEDLQRLRREGYEPIIHGSRQHFCLFLHSKMVFATHAAMYKFNAIPEDEVPYLQDLLHADYVYISHGLSVQNLVEANNQAQNNTKLYYCASKYEVANLMQPAYGYQGTDIIRLKGLARFDGLVNDDKRQLLITPTWRNYIALTPDNPNETRPYSSLFKETDYYKIFNRVITDKKLLESAQKNGYRIIYLVHPNIEAQAVDFEEREGVTVISGLEANYEKLLRESSLMVTDYSGVQFDFVHMRKPIVYYHPPQLPPHYEDGGFFYDTQGFGEICTEHTELVNLLCEYMEDGCELRKFYRARQDDYLEFSDHNSCRRIYDDAYAWQQRQKKANRKIPAILTMPHRVRFRSLDEHGHDGQRHQR